MFTIARDNVLWSLKILFVGVMARSILSEDLFSVISQVDADQLALGCPAEKLSLGLTSNIIKLTTDVPVAKTNSLK